MGRLSNHQSATVSEEQILAALRQVQEPELGGDLVSRQMVKHIAICDGIVRCTIELTTPACPLKDQIRAEAEAAVQAVPGVKEVHIDFTANVRRPAGIPEQAAIPGVANVVAVAAGKGGREKYYSGQSGGCAGADGCSGWFARCRCVWAELTADVGGARTTDGCQ